MDLTRIKSIQTINLVFHKMVLILTTFNHLMPRIAEDHNHQKVRRKISLDLMKMGQLQI